MKRSRTSTAFTLIEVTVSLAIFSLAVVVLTQAYVNTMISLDTIDNETALEADLKFVRSQIIRTPDRDILENGGRMETLSSGTAYWRVEIEQALVSDLFYVTLIIELSSIDSGESNEYTQNLLLLRPTWSDPIERSTILAENSDRLLFNRLKKY